MSLFEVEEATQIIHEAAGDDANVILGAVVDGDMSDDLMVTVIATGFNRPGITPTGARQVKPVRVVDRIPSGVDELQKFDEPAYIRRGIDINVNPYRDETDQPESREKIDKNDPEKPAFLRKIMD